MITNSDEWKRAVAANLDAYGKACIDVARAVMHLIDEPETPLVNVNASELIYVANRKLKAGLTGFQAGAVAELVSKVHSRGDEFRVSWNNNYGHEGGGIVNPAIMTIDTKE